VVVFRTGYIQRCSVLVLCSLLTLVLAACEVGGDYTPVATPIPSPIVPAVHLRTLRGQGYSIGYPENWIVTQASNGSVTIREPQGLAFMVIEVLPNAEGTLTAHAEIENSLRTNTFNLIAYQRIKIATTAVVGGDTWSQGAANGDIVIKDRALTLAGRMVLIADNHPANSPATNMFVIRYAAAQSIFDVANVTYFLPMLKSFKFV
jgi:hypothetical protein